MAPHEPFGYRPSRRQPQRPGSDPFLRSRSQRAHSPYDDDLTWDDRTAADDAYDREFGMPYAAGFDPDHDRDFVDYEPPDYDAEYDRELGMGMDTGRGLGDGYEDGGVGYGPHYEPGYDRDFVPLHRSERGHEGDFEFGGRPAGRRQRERRIGDRRRRPDELGGWAERDSAEWHRYRDFHYGHTPSDRWPDSGHRMDELAGEPTTGDEEVRDAVYESLFQDSWIDPELIDVEVSDGVVTLRGEVDDFLQARYAWDDAWEAEGVHGVINNLTVRTAEPHGRMGMPQTVHRR